MRFLASCRVIAVCAVLTLLPQPALPEDLYIVPSTANGKNVSVDCMNFIEWPNGFIGYAGTLEEQTTELGCTPGITDCGCGISVSYCWAVSLSSSSPGANVGPLTSDTLYLWAVDGSRNGLSAAEFAFAGSLDVDELIPLNGFLNAGSPAEPLLATLCVNSSWVLAAELRVSRPVSIDSRSWGGIKSLYR